MCGHVCVVMCGHVCVHVCVRRLHGSLGSWSHGRTVGEGPPRRGVKGAGAAGPTPEMPWEGSPRRQEGESG